MTEQSPSPGCHSFVPGSPETPRGFQLPRFSLISPTASSSLQSPLQFHITPQNRGLAGPIAIGQEVMFLN